MRIGGLQIVNFCKRTAVHVFEYDLSKLTDTHLINNELPDDGSIDEEEYNLDSRKKRQTDVNHRVKRYRGQTQTQYVAFNKEGSDGKTGTAEAVAQHDLSRATVSKYTSLHKH